ncbi:hypothetical protein [Phycicoccus avicenniae]|uniref:hypothetical protein n=1 Tax=Phycicoccus avicenniae TaxID=2828860 RepID=UPI003D2BCB21
MRRSFGAVVAVAALAAALSVLAASRRPPTAVLALVAAASAVSFVHGLVAVVRRTAGPQRGDRSGKGLRALLGHPSTARVVVIGGLALGAWVVLVVGLTGLAGGVPERSADRACPFVQVDHGTRECLDEDGYRSLVARSQAAALAAASFFAGVGALLAGPPEDHRARRRAASAGPVR